MHVLFVHYVFFVYSGRFLTPPLLFVTFYLLQVRLQPVADPLTYEFPKKKKKKKKNFFNFFFFFWGD